MVLLNDIGVSRLCRKFCIIGTEQSGVGKSFVDNAHREGFTGGRSSIGLLFAFGVLEYRNVPYSLQVLGTVQDYKKSWVRVEKYTFLGLLAKITCSICSYQFNI
jgi:tetrahydromethanopterin S-methyltransferase subunit D